MKTANRQEFRVDSLLLARSHLLMLRHRGGHRFLVHFVHLTERRRRDQRRCGEAAYET